jgi:hypothetical protein
MRYQCSSSSPLEHRSLLLVRHLELFFNKCAMLLSQNQPIAALYPPLAAGAASVLVKDQNRRQTFSLLKRSIIGSYQRLAT